ncbi:hypothetical protein [Corynebacterium sp. HMSC072A02]|uniref:hypothetical protein n=1 Tax=Corynebacterium sp. HMSC072A02 TaxID=1715177 RepID=UPI0008A54814|nr:hypothetical protein [Corynebacterium sp. HMSC072A02]OFM33548.1 hypothetical protein HMPREF2698_06485 [Corynebacterium sp. HMSC072A02]
MKLFSRKALVAAATTAAVSLSGVTVATAETANDNTAAVNEPTNDAPKSEGEDNNKKDDKKDEESSSSSSDDSEGSSISDMKPSEIRDWIAVFTAIIGALGTVFAFYNKNFAK